MTLHKVEKYKDDRVSFKKALKMWGTLVDEKKRKKKRDASMIAYLRKTTARTLRMAGRIPSSTGSFFCGDVYLSKQQSQRGAWHHQKYFQPDGPNLLQALTSVEKDAVGVVSAPVPSESIHVLVQRNRMSILQSPL